MAHHGHVSEVDDMLKAPDMPCEYPQHFSSLRYSQKLILSGLSSFVVPSSVQRFDSLAGSVVV